ncbi:MAG: single-stranded DNA-binding protein [Mycoplasmoidaceae bacterium]
MNKIFLAGRLAADPQPFVTQTGKLISNISIACQDNINKNEVYFFPCIAWQSNAKFINTYMKKGDLVVVDGKLVRRSYVNKEGRNTYITEIVIDTIKPLGGKRPTEDLYGNPNQNYNMGNMNNQEIHFQDNSARTNAYNVPPTPMTNNPNPAQTKNAFNEELISQAESYIFNEPLTQTTSSEGFEDITDLDWLEEIDK